MRRHVLIRLLLCPVILWAVYTVTFVMAVSAPGNAFENPSRNLPPDVVRAVLARYHADDSWRLYWEYLAGVTGVRRLTTGQGPWIDLGPSWSYRDWTCNQIVADSLPISLILGLTAVIIAVIVGVIVGVFGAVRRYSWFDYFSLGLVLVGISLPSFIPATLLLIVFAVELCWLRIGEWGSLSQVWVPAVVLSLPLMAYIARLTRLGMLDVLQSDYIRTARAKGAPPRRVIWKHAFRNACLPVLSFLGPASAAAMTGSFVMEKVFAIPGLGQHFVNSVLSRDQMLILACVLVYSAVLVVMNLLVDVLYTFVDPRIELEAPA
jgi:oligopeptide transport system permease protein